MRKKVFSFPFCAYSAFLRVAVSKSEIFTVLILTVPISCHFHFYTYENMCESVYIRDYIYEQLVLALACEEECWVC